MEKITESLSENPIQLDQIIVDHIYFHRHSDCTPDLVKKVKPVLQIYDGSVEDASGFSFTIRMVYGMPGFDMDDGASDFTGKPFSLLVQLTGMFRPTIEGVTKEACEQFYKDYALYILYPFLREHVYDLTLRGCRTGILTPLLRVPSQI